MKLFRNSLIIFVVLMLLFTITVDGRRRRTHKAKLTKKQLFFLDETRETSPPNFLRLVLMRLIYGIAVQMGVEERLDGVLNGAFVPPNAEDDYGDIGDFGDDIGDLGGDDIVDF